MNKTLYIVTLHSTSKLSKKQEQPTTKPYSLKDSVTGFILGKNWLQPAVPPVEINSTILAYRHVICDKLSLTNEQIEAEMNIYFNTIIGVKENVTVKVDSIDNFIAVDELWASPADYVIELKDTMNSLTYYTSSNRRTFKSEYTTASWKLKDEDYEDYVDYLRNANACQLYKNRDTVQVLKTTTLPRVIEHQTWEEMFGDSETKAAVEPTFDPLKRYTRTYVCFFQPAIQEGDYSKFNLEPIIITQDYNTNSIICTSLCNEYTVVPILRRIEPIMTPHNIEDYYNEIQKVIADYETAFEKRLEENVYKEVNESEGDKEDEDEDEEGEQDDEQSDDSATVLSIDVKKQMTPEDIAALRAEWKEFLIENADTGTDTMLNRNDKEYVRLGWLYRQTILNARNTFPAYAVNNIFDENYMISMRLRKNPLFMQFESLFEENEYKLTDMYTMLMNPSGISKDMKTRIVSLFSKKRLIKSSGDTIESKTMYTIFTEYSSVFPHFEVLVKQIGQKTFTQIMKSLGFTMTRRSKGMMYLDVKTEDIQLSFGNDEYETHGEWSAAGAGAHGNKGFLKNLETSCEPSLKYVVNKKDTLAYVTASNSAEYAFETLTSTLSSEKDIQPFSDMSNYAYSAC